MTRYSCSALLPLFTVCALVAVTACKDSGTGPTGGNAVGTVGFSYTGDRSGSYVAAGDVVLDDERRPQYGTWAAALPDAEGDIQIAATRAQSAPLANVFLLTLHNVTAPGTYPIDLDCTQETRSSCAIGFFAFGYNWADVDESPDALYLVAGGSVTIVEIGGGQVRGTFQGEGLKLPVGGGATISFSSGSFDVPVVRNTMQIRPNRLIAGGVLEILHGRNPL